MASPGEESFFEDQEGMKRIKKKPKKKIIRGKNGVILKFKQDPEAKERARQYFALMKETYK
jgi:hypothetical protein